VGIVVTWQGPHGVVRVKPDLVVAGLDWGFYPDPFVLEVGIRCGLVWLNIDEVYEVRQSAVDILKTVGTLHRTYHFERIWADPSEQTAISFMQAHGMPVIPNQIRDVAYGMRVMYGLLKATANHPQLGPGPRLRFDKTRCPNVVNEFSQYRVPEVKGERRGKPVGKDHGLDATRYYITGEGEIPPEMKAAGPLERPRMFVDDQGRWRDDPQATIMQRALQNSQEPDDWLGEGGVEIDERFVVSEGDL